MVEDSQIIDEILFIENKKLIKDYYDHKQKMEEEEIKTLEVRFIYKTEKSEIKSVFNIFSVSQRIDRV